MQVSTLFALQFLHWEIGIDMHFHHYPRPALSTCYETLVTTCGGTYNPPNLSANCGIQGRATHPTLGLQPHRRDAK